MSYKVRLCVTHIATALITGYCVWYGLQVRGFSQLAFMILLGAGIGVPCGLAAWWMVRGLSRLEESLLAVHGDGTPTGIAELDTTLERLRDSLSRQRALVQNVDELMVCLGHAPLTGDNGAAGSLLLTEAMGRLSRSSARDLSSIMALSNDIAKAAHDAQWGSQEQVRAVESAVISVEALSAGVDDVTGDANAAAEASRDVARNAETGLELIKALIRGMEEIRNNVAFSEKKVASLGQQSEQISSIVETIGDISARTDMLALNASIEAVRAGKDGRGFTVVAEEVRKLADSTATASRDIAALVAAIQSEAQDTVAAMLEECHQVQEEIQRVSEAGRTLQDISRTSMNAAEQSRRISRQASGQLQRTQEVVRAMQQVSSIAARISERSESIRHKTTDLVEAAQGLEEGFAPMYHFGEAEANLTDRSAPPAASTGNGAATRRRNRPNPGEELVAAVEGGEFVQ